MSQNRLDLSSKTVEEIEALIAEHYAIVQDNRRQVTVSGDSAELMQLDLSLISQYRNRIDELKRAAYTQTEGMPPGYEPQGYSCEPGYVKMNPANNDFYLQKLVNWDWYPAIERCHETLNKIIPGYNISQIKEKFNSLCYYFTFPEQIEVNENSYLNTVDKVKAACHEAVNSACYWVAGYEAAKSDFKTDPEAKSKEWLERVNWTSPERSSYRDRNSKTEF